MFILAQYNQKYFCKSIKERNQRMKFKIIKTFVFTILSLTLITQTNSRQIGCGVYIEGPNVLWGAYVWHYAIDLGENKTYGGRDYEVFIYCFGWSGVCASHNGQCLHVNAPSNFNAERLVEGESEEYHLTIFGSTDSL